MKTDFQNINFFETGVIIMTVIGAGLLIAILYSGLAPSQQDQVLIAVRILDVHEQAADQAETLRFAFDASHSFLDEFYLAFSQVAVLPDRIFETTSYNQAYQTLLVYSDYLAINYQNQNSPRKALAYDHGKILGAVMDSTSNLEFPKTRGSEPESLLNFSYHYQAPSLDGIVGLYTNLLNK